MAAGEAGTSWPLAGNEDAGSVAVPSVSRSVSASADPSTGGSVGGSVGGSSSVVLVGAGPRGLGMLERLTADAVAAHADPTGADTAAGTGTATGAPRRLDVHLVDPFPPGGGRVWRAAQPEVLWLNSRAVDVTLYPDDSVAMAGARRPGPTFWEWVAAGGGGGPDGQPPSADVDADGRADSGSFLPRTTFTGYLDDVLGRVRAGLPPWIHLTVHADTVLDVRDSAAVPAEPPRRDVAQEVVLASGTVLAADVVVLCQGHAPVEVEPALTRFAAAAADHGLTWIAPGYGADIDLDALRAGEAVLVRGLGLGFLDEVVALTEGRGGRYERQPGGGVRYRASGAEPRLFAGSRRGLPYHAKPLMELGAPRATLPRYATPAAAHELRAAAGHPLDLRADLWPLVAKDLAFAWYRELFLAHPERVRGRWEEVETALDDAAWDSVELLAAIADAVPDPADRFDPVRLDRPAGGRTFAGLEDYNAWARAHLRLDIDRRSTDANSMELALFWALLVEFGTLSGLAAAGVLTARSRVQDLEGRFFSFLSSFASGPPRLRLEQLIALGDAGVLTLLGPHTSFDVDDAAGDFVASSPAVGEVVHARALLEARLPGPSVLRSRDPLTRALLARGEIAEEVVADDLASFATGRVAARQPDQRMLLADGSAHPRRFAVGAWAQGGRTSAGLPRPHFNAGFFRQNDTVALAVLELLDPPARTEPPAGGAVSVASAAPDTAGRRGRSGANADADADADAGVLDPQVTYQQQPA